MKRTWSFEDELLTDITIFANTEFLKWDKNLSSEEITEMAKSLIINPEVLLSETTKQCLEQVVQSLKESGLTTGYPHGRAEIIGILSRNYMLNVISENVDATMKKPQHFYNDLADDAGYHVFMFERDAYSKECIEYFNEKLPASFKHKITKIELQLLYWFYCFISNQLEWQEEQEEWQE